MNRFIYVIKIISIHFTQLNTFYTAQYILHSSQSHLTVYSVGSHITGTYSLSVPVT